MMRLRQLAPILAILLAFAAGFGARRSAQKDAEPEPVSDGEGIVEPQVSDPRPTAIAQGKGLLRLTAERFEAGDVLGSATALYQWLRESDSDTMTEFIDSLIELDETGDSPGFWGDDRAEEFFPIIVMRIAETDAEYVSEQLGEDENLASSALAAAELRGDPAAALADAPDSMLDFCRQFIAARHAEFNLPAAKELEVPLDWYVGIWLHRGLDPAVLLRDEESLDTDVVRAIVRDQMKERDVDAIKAFVDKIEDPQLLETVRSCVGEVLQTDLKKALESLKLLSVLDLAFPEQKGGGASISLWHYYHAALSERPTETIEWLMSFSPEKRKAALSHIFTNSLSGSTNTTAWLELYRRLPREELPEFMSLHLYLRSLIRGDPEATLDWFEAIADADHFSTGEDSDFNEEDARDKGVQLGQSLSTSGVEVALERARRIGNEALREAVIAGIIKAMVPYDLEGARALLDEIGEPLRVDRESEIFRQEFRQAEHGAGMQSLLAIPDRDRRNRFAYELVHDAGVPLSSRAAVVEAFQEVPGLLKQSRHSITNPWAKEAPGEAAAWITQFADHESFADHVRELMRPWVEIDINGAAAWLRELKPGKARDVGASAIVERAIYRDPHTALEWANSITDPELRTTKLKRALIRLDRAATVPNEAREAFDALPLNPDDHAALVEILEGE